MVVRAQAWCAVVAATGRDGGLMERVDEGTPRHTERNVDRRIVGLASRDPEVRLGRHAEPGDVNATGYSGSQLHYQLIADRREGSSIERLALSEVADRESRVIDHGCIIALRADRVRVLPCVSVAESIFLPATRS